ncbi:hypothetical protein [Pseudonocardia humida]|uniref:YacP-like NYN domain-containing protein n=1 Tax=Pseudonocardia humida TaxID=2800819 RepID=A0ABT1A763_9PSEU|nr:hypothetical protein [Pseudonocardia humida]MCO1658811.1 hypothetical protein [Pseudonocardia humida]
MAAEPGPLHVVVDGANVVGSRPDGWWRDRPGAARRLTGQLVALLTTGTRELAAALGQPADRSLRLHLVLEGEAARVEDLSTHALLDVVRADRDGDSAIVALVGELDGDDRLVVTADRELRDRVRAAGADTAGPGALLTGLPG